MIMTDQIAREVIRSRTTRAHVYPRPRSMRTARALRGLADRFDRQS